MYVSCVYNLNLNFLLQSVARVLCLAELQKAIVRDFGSLENMQNQLSVASVAVQGSGWGWLGYNRQTSRLQLATTFNQDLLEPTHGTVTRAI